MNKHTIQLHPPQGLLHLPVSPLQAAYENQEYTEAPTDGSTSDSTYTTASTTAGVWNYMFGTALLLVCFVGSLMLPKGLRKQVLRAQPRRYSRRRYAPTDIESIAGGTNTVMSAMQDTLMGSVDESVLLEVERRRVSEMSVAQTTLAGGTTIGGSVATMGGPVMHHSGMRPPRSTTSDSTTTGTNNNNHGGSVYLRPMTRSTKSSSRGGSYSGSNGTPNRTPNRGGLPPHANLFRVPSPALGLPPPSPGHPAIARLPSAKILNETMQRLQTRGIRLMAHGIASDSKRVWIKLEQDDSDSPSLSWQTEFPRKIPNQLGEISLVMMRGALHKIALPNVLYVDVGKKTNALLKAGNQDVLDTTCFSLLTQNGSLDLQANSRLERDALVSCFSMVLDQIHTQDWRSLYADSPETSTVGHFSQAMQSSAVSSCTGSADLNQVEF